MQRARRAAKMLGGGMRQAGLIAAPALVALRDPYGIHARDHALAGSLARGIAGIDETLVDTARVQTNIVNCRVDAFADDAGEINRALAACGVLANSSRTKIRFVTHSQVDQAAVDAALHALGGIIRSLPKRGQST